MVNRDTELVKYLVIEDGVEGATTAKHKVEFAFYNLNESNKPSKVSKDLFGIIECKKVGVEQTVKQNFKTWKPRRENKRNFNLTDGYSYTIAPRSLNFRWAISVTGINGSDKNLRISATKIENGTQDITETKEFSCKVNSEILIGYSVLNELFILGPTEQLSAIEASIKKCVIIQVKSLMANNIKSIHVNESLPGPQTPEKAKQASFVSLDVRKKVLGRFDRTENNDFISILVIGEASHWEKKSRAMIRLCNDFNLIIPDAVLVKLFLDFSSHFGDNYQTTITKTAFRQNEEVRKLVDGVIDHFEGKVLYEMESQNFVEFEYYSENYKNKVRLKPKFS